MRAASQALINLLNGNNQFLMCDLYTFTLSSGSVLRYADFDIDVTYGGNTYQSSGPIFTRDKTRLVLGIQVDTMNVDIAPRSGNTIAGLLWMQAVAAGYLDGGYVEVDRAFMSAPGVVVGTVIMFGGRIGELQIRRSIVSITAKSDLELLNIQLPRNLYQPGCMHNLYDSRCTLLTANYTDAQTVASGSTPTLLMSTSARPDGYFSMGYVTFTSGQNAGLSRTVKAYNGGQYFTLLNPLPVAPAIGDTFNAYPGCDKTLATCQSKFNNQTNFRGFPFIPVPETAI